jgi:hypothetical protein
VIAWDILNSLARIGIAIIIVWKLYRFNALFNVWERYGMGMAGGCSILTISVIWQGERSVYDGWATSTFSVGVFLYFIGRMSRHWRHERNNRFMINMARDHQKRAR